VMTMVQVVIEHWDIKDHEFLVLPDRRDKNKRMQTLASTHVGNIILYYRLELVSIRAEPRNDREREHVCYRRRTSSIGAASSWRGLCNDKVVSSNEFVVTTKATPLSLQIGMS
jgi:hypothetical protein